MKPNGGKRAKLIVIGCGNRLAGDDAVGLEITDALRLTPSDKYEIREMSDLGPGFLADVSAVGNPVLLVDAVQSGTQPGTIHFLRLPSATVRPRNIGAISTHGFHLDQELELATRLNGKPPHVFLLGIAVLKCEPGTPLSERVRDAAQRAIQTFREGGWPVH